MFFYSHNIEKEDMEKEDKVKAAIDELMDIIEIRKHADVISYVGYFLLKRTSGKQRENTDIVVRKKYD